MLDWMMILWIVVFLIFLFINIAVDSANFGIIAGMWFLLMGIGIITTGIEYQSGMNITEVGSTQVINYTYSIASYPFSTYSYLWGFIIIAVSIYIIYANGLERVS